MSLQFRKNKTWTEEQKKEIIEYANMHGIWSVKAKFNVWPETVKYWINPELRNKIKKISNESYKKTKQDVDVNDRKREYRKMRAESGDTARYWKQWYKSLSTNKKEQNSIRIKQHRLDNKEQYKQRAQKHYVESKPHLREKYNTDPLHKMKCNIREHIRQAIKYANCSKHHPSIVYLGCTIEEFKQHIEKQFRPGMTWDNHGRGEQCWHLDHIKPLCCLQQLTPEHLKDICHFSNYQPLWEIENLTKNAKFQETDTKISNTLHDQIN